MFGFTAWRRGRRRAARQPRASSRSCVVDRRAPARRERDALRRRATRGDRRLGADHRRRAALDRAAAHGHRRPSAARRARRRARRLRRARAARAAERRRAALGAAARRLLVAHVGDRLVPLEPAAAPGRLVRRDVVRDARRRPDPAADRPRDDASALLAVLGSLDLRLLLSRHVRLGRSATPRTSGCSTTRRSDGSRRTRT